MLKKIKLKKKENNMINNGILKIEIDYWNEVKHMRKQTKKNEVLMVKNGIKKIKKDMMLGKKNGITITKKNEKNLHVNGEKITEIILEKTRTKEMLECA